MQNAHARTISEGATAVVLAHHSNGGVCQWTSEAVRLEDAGYRVIVASVGVGNPLGAVAAADAFVRAAGAERVALVGASIGGLYAIASAAALPTPPIAVVALSPAVHFPGIDIFDYAAFNAAPTFIAVGTDDQQFPDDAADIALAIPAHPEPLEIDGNAHGVQLLGDDAVRSAVDDFLAEHAPAR